MAESPTPLRSILSAAATNSASAKQVSFSDTNSIRLFDPSDSSDQSDVGDSHDQIDSSDDECESDNEERDPLAIDPEFVPMHVGNSSSSTPVIPTKRGRGRPRRTEPNVGGRVPPGGTNKIVRGRGRPRRTEQTVRGPDGKVADGSENRSPPPHSPRKRGRPKLQSDATGAKYRKQSPPPRRSVANGGKATVKRSPPQQQLLHFKLDHLVGRNSLRKRQLTQSFGARMFQSKVRLRVVLNMEDLLCMHVDEVAHLLGDQEVVGRVS